MIRLVIAVAAIFSHVDADNLYIENPDKLVVTLLYNGKDLLISSSESRIVLYNQNPLDNQTTFDVKVGEQVQLNLRTSSNDAVYEKRHGCTYSLVVDSHGAWPIYSLHAKYGCTPSNNTYTKYSYTIVNENQTPIYPAFATWKVDDFAADSVLGLLRFNEVRSYTLDGPYWASIGITNNSIQVGFYDPFEQFYHACTQKFEQIDRSRVYHVINSHTCTEEAQNLREEISWMLVQPIRLIAERFG